MKILVAMPTKAPKDAMIALGLEYLSRLSSSFKASALLFNPSSRNDDDAERRKTLEGESLLLKSQGTFRIALTENGRHFNTCDFARYLEKLSAEHSQVSFIIGGAFGLSSQVLEKSQATLSLSAMTMPHRLAFLVLSEQLYRASELKRGSPYHK